MLTKIFTTISGSCPFGRGCAIDSTECRKCEHFYRVGTATFFWCRHPQEGTKDPEPAKVDPVKKDTAKPTKPKSRKAEPKRKKPKKGHKNAL